MSSHPPQILMKPKEAAKFLAISEKTLWNLRKRGEIPYLKIGRSVRYPVDDLRRWISRRRKGGEA